MSKSPPPIRNLPGPWHLTGVQIFSLSWPNNQSDSSSPPPPPEQMYSPLEASSAFADPQISGRAVEGDGRNHIHLVRFRDSPAGAYDEMAVVRPYEYVYESAEGKRETRRHARVVRIYISAENRESIWNGRYHYNMPKHPARFEWTTHADGSTSVKVFPHDTHPDDGEPESAAAALKNALETHPSPTPFFQATFKATPWIPAFPFSTRIYAWLGIDASVVGPPLPQGRREDIVGTDRWAGGTLDFSTWRANLGWFDLRQGTAEDEEGREFWPGLGRFVRGFRLDNATVVIPPPKHWDAPKSME